MTFRFYEVFALGDERQHAPNGVPMVGVRSRVNGRRADDRRSLGSAGRTDRWETCGPRSGAPDCGAFKNFTQISGVPTDGKKLETTVCGSDTRSAAVLSGCNALP